MPFIHKPTPEEIDQAVQDHKTEILDDMGTAVSSRSDVMPLTVPDFTSLHDYVDANTYAGFCGAEDGGVDRSNWFDPDSYESAAVLNTIQDRVDEWLKSGEAYAERIAMPARVEQNDNCLDGWRCPKCGNEGEEETFNIQITTWIALNNDGTDDSESSHEFDGDALTQCQRCGFSGDGRIFDIEVQQGERALRDIVAMFEEKRDAYSVCLLCGKVINYRWGSYRTEEEQKAPGYNGRPSCGGEAGNEHSPKWLTMAQFRQETSHIPGWYPITADGETDHLGSWFNLGLGLVPELAEIAQEPTSLMLDIRDDFDTRQW